MKKLKFKPFKKQKIVVERKEYCHGHIRRKEEELDDAFERSVSIQLDELGKIDLTFMSEFKNRSWGCGSGQYISPEEFLALKKLLNKVEVEEVETE